MFKERTYETDMYFTLKYVAADLYRPAQQPKHYVQFWTPTLAKQHAERNITALLRPALPELQLAAERRELEARLV